MIRAISLALFGAASFAVVYWTTAPDKSQIAVAPATESESSSPAAIEPATVSPSADATTSQSQSPPSIPQVQAELRPTETPHQIRDVTPDNMTAAPPVAGPLARVAPPTAKEPASPASHKARLERLFNPLVVSAGTIEADDKEIHLAGISVTKPDATCGDGADEWPCGRVARAALRSFIRGRAIECEIPAGANAIPDPARCLVGGEDIAEWLVAQGWAKRNGSDYAEQADAAKEMQLGLFGKSRPDIQPDEVAAQR